MAESGMGLPHSKTLWRKRRFGLRVSVLECGSPMPLSFERPQITRHILSQLNRCVKKTRLA
jgi:hypothetical protein